MERKVRRMSEKRRKLLGKMWGNKRILLRRVKMTEQRRTLLTTQFIFTPNNKILSAGSRKSSSTIGLSRFSLNLLIRYIENGLSAVTNQKIFKSRLSTEAHSMAVDVLKGLGNAVGLLAIANVLERLDNISSNDREFIDLLKDMLKLGIYI
ncbi:hypothetical protein SUGI_0703110 [Cryptomeria japonica]|nr:hypothetical protein SUGI_0703110 [Cryptomeria japonica]